jgi:hypothetical protein
LIGAIYDCALEPERWPATLTRIREALDFADASLSLVALPSGDVLLLDVMSSADPIWIERAPQNREGVIEIWGGEEAVRTLPLAEPLVLSRVRRRGRCSPPATRSAPSTAGFASARPPRQQRLPWRSGGRPRMRPRLATAGFASPRCAPTARPACCTSCR